MVKQQPSEIQVQAPEGTGRYLPRRAQPWETAMILFGVPGALFSAIAVSASVVAGVSVDPLLALTASVVVLTGYLSGIALLALGVAAERDDLARRG